MTTPPVTDKRRANASLAPADGLEEPTATIASTSTAAERIRGSDIAACWNPRFRKSNVGWHEIRCMACFGCEIFRSQRDYSRLIHAAERGRLGRSTDAMQLTATTLRGSRYGPNLAAYHPEVFKRDVRKFNDTLRQRVHRARKGRGDDTPLVQATKVEPHPTGKHRRLHAHSHVNYGDVLVETLGLRTNETLPERWQRAEFTWDRQTSRVRSYLRYLIDNTPGHSNLRYRRAWRNALEQLPSRAKRYPPATVTRKRKKARRSLETCGLRDAATRRAIGLLHVEPTEADLSEAWLWLTARRHNLGTIQLQRKAGADTAKYMAELAGKHMDGIAPEDLGSTMREVYRPLTRGQKQHRRFMYGKALHYEQAELADMPYCSLLPPDTPYPSDSVDVMRRMVHHSALFKEERIIYRQAALTAATAAFTKANGDVDYWEDLRRKESRIRGRLQRLCNKGLTEILSHQWQRGLSRSWYIRELQDEKYNKPYALADWAGEHTAAQLRRSLKRVLDRKKAYQWHLQKQSGYSVPLHSRALVRHLLNHEGLAPRGSPLAARR